MSFLVSMGLTVVKHEDEFSKLHCVLLYCAMANKNEHLAINTPCVMLGAYDTGQIFDTEITAYRTYVRSLTTIGVNNGRKARPPSPYSLRYEKWETPPVQYTRRNEVYKFSANGTEVYYGVSPQNAPPLDSQLSVAINSALSKLKTGGSNVGVMLGESQQSINMIRSKLDAIRVFANWAKYGSPNKRKRKRRRSETEIQNLWLELQYGWLPLMSDLDGLLSALAGNVAHGYVLAKGRAMNRDSGAESLTPWAYETSHGCKLIWERTMSNQVILHADLENKSAALNAAMGLTNPLIVAWELIPFSFVADWFIPIGKTLDVLDATSGYSFREGCYSTKSTYQYSGTIDSVTVFQNGMDVATRKGSVHYESVNFDRGVYNSFPWPQPPKFKNPLSILHAANALALLTQTFRNR